MAYTLEAFVTKSSTADEAIKSFSSAVVVPLEQGVSLIPLTDTFTIELEAKYGPGPNFEFEDLPTLTGSAAKWAEQISHTGPVAFLEAEFFGGQGSQAAIGWQAGKIAFGPLQAGHAINQALHWLEITPAGQTDEFDTLRLGRYRSTEKWANG
jgi:hypothetical protein